MTAWRSWALAVSSVVAIGGMLLWYWGGGPMLLIFGVLMAITAALEPIYGRANGQPLSPAWRATDERFVDPESGKLVTVWFDPETGERRYVEGENAEHPTAT